MALAQLSAQRSKDPSTQVGAVLVSKEKLILSIGYNGLPKGCDDDEFPWAREAENPLDTKYPFIVHAEANAVLNRNSQNLKGSTLYVSLFPCNECTKLLIQSGVEEVVFMSDKYHDTVPMTASRKMLDAAGVKYRQFIPPMEKLVLDFKA
jgi:dCMP deaminase